MITMELVAKIKPNLYDKITTQNIEENSIIMKNAPIPTSDKRVETSFF